MAYRSRKPLIFWCRWHDGVLRIMGRDGDIVTGQITFALDGASETFRYAPETWLLTVGERTMQLDEMGVEVEPPVPE